LYVKNTTRKLQYTIIKYGKIKENKFDDENNMLSKNERIILTKNPVNNITNETVKNANICSKVALNFKLILIFIFSPYLVN
jgi:hypothetical protein